MCEFFSLTQKITLQHHKKKKNVTVTENNHSNSYDILHSPTISFNKYWLTTYKTPETIFYNVAII